MYGLGKADNTSASLSTDTKEAWKRALKSASEKLGGAISLSGQNVDMSSRLGMRVSMLRDELATTREMIGV